MRILFCNNSFPGQFEALAGRLAAHPEHEVFFASNYGRRDFSIAGVRRIVLKARHDRAPKAGDETVRQWAGVVHTARTARDVFIKLGEGGFAPDMVLFSAACAESLFLQEAFPHAYRVAYLNADKLAPEQGRACEKSMPEALMQGMALLHAHTAFVFGEAQNLPPLLRSAVGVIPPCVDTEFFRSERPFAIDGEEFLPGTELISVETAGLPQSDPLPVAMAHLLRQRPECHVLLTGGDSSLSGPLEALARVFPDRVHTMGQVSRATYRDMLSASAVRIVPTPDCTMRILMEALSCGTLLLSRTCSSSDAGPLVPGKTMLAWPDTLKGQLHLLNDMLNNHAVAEKLRHEAREAVLAHYELNTVLSNHVETLFEGYRCWKTACCEQVRP